MSESNIELNTAQNAYELGSLVGRHEALGLIASRCSAADAATLRRIRDQELWRSQAATWNEFCETRLRMSRSNANRLIRLLEEFGDPYFTISQATCITPQTYRAIAPAIRDNALHVGGEAIALTEENAPRIAAAVDALRKTIAVKAIEAPQAPQDPLEVLDRHCTDLMGEISGVLNAVRSQPGERTLRTILGMMRARLGELDAAIAAGTNSNG
jgi:hypothetical protein